VNTKGKGVACLKFSDLLNESGDFRLLNYGAPFFPPPKALYFVSDEPKLNSHLHSLWIGPDAADT
jgi:hypothetical protein